MQGRARQLYKAGYKNIRQVAFATPEELVKAVEHMPKKVARELVAAAKVQDLLTLRPLEGNIKEFQIPL